MTQMTDLNRLFSPCKVWLLVPTPHSCCVETAVAREDTLSIPLKHNEALCDAVAKIAADIHAQEYVDTDEHYPQGFPKRTQLVNVEGHAVRVMIMPTVLWQAATDYMN
jgi:hypothetical protein